MPWLTDRRLDRASLVLVNVATTDMRLERRPIGLTEAKRFVIEHHRHCVDPTGWKFGTSLWLGDELRAVGTAGRPTGRGFDDGLTIECTRVCTLGDHNACSMLYGALCRAAKALGYRRAITYTLASEAGVSPAAAGFVVECELPAREASVSASRARYDANLFGEATRPTEPKLRWVRLLVGPEETT